jgi:hypothetical protein
VVKDIEAQDIGLRGDTEHSGCHVGAVRAYSELVFTRDDIVDRVAREVELESHAAARGARRWARAEGGAVRADRRIEDGHCRACTGPLRLVEPLRLDVRQRRLELQVELPIGQHAQDVAHGLQPREVIGGQVEGDHAEGTIGVNDTRRRPCHASQLPDQGGLLAFKDAHASGRLRVGRSAAHERLLRRGRHARGYVRLPQLNDHALC